MGVDDCGQVDLAGIDLLFQDWGNPRASFSRLWTRRVL